MMYLAFAFIYDDYSVRLAFMGLGGTRARSGLQLSLLFREHACNK